MTEKLNGFGWWFVKVSALLPGLVLATTICGCSNPKAAWETVYPASGEIKFKGKSLADAEISFFPVDTTFPDTVRPKAKSKEDGTFVVSTFDQGDGAPAGTYKVTVVHHVVAVSKDTIVAKPNDLPHKYSLLESTNLEVKVTEGQNQIPLDLK